MISFHSLHVTPKQDYLHSIHFHSFPFLYFKTSNQGYLIPIHSILFHSFPLLKYIPFHSITLHSLIIIPFNSIPFHSLMNSQAKPQNLKFSFPLKLRGIGRNEIRFNDFFIKTPKIPLYIQPLILKWGLIVILS